MKEYHYIICLQVKETQTNRQLRYTCLCGPEWLCSSPAAGGAFTHTPSNVSARPLLACLHHRDASPVGLSGVNVPLSGLTVGWSEPDHAPRPLKPAHLKGPSLLVKKEQLHRDRRFHRAYLDRNTV